MISLKKNIKPLRVTVSTFIQKTVSFNGDEWSTKNNPEAFQHLDTSSAAALSSHKLTKFYKSLINLLFIPATYTRANLASIQNELKGLLVNSFCCTPHFRGLQLGYRCQNGFQSSQGCPTGCVQSVVYMKLHWVSSQGKKSCLSLGCFPVWLFLPGWDLRHIADVLTEAGVRSLQEVLVFKPNWETQSEPWLSVHAYFGFRVLGGTLWYHYL